ncbi:hypothetical protein HDE_02023 [Halotydeus destructor]|nr:hypothetical protein HDE_02023 [Halotydeus destructor]
MQQIQETQDITKFESIITPENNLVVFTLMRDSYLKIYKYQEASGFVLMDGLHGRGATKMAVKPTFDLDHFLVMGTDSREEDKSNGVTRGLVSVHSKITSRRFLG